MSKISLLSGLTAAFGVMATACWFITGILPLQASPHTTGDVRSLPAAATAPLAGALLKSISITGLSDGARDQLLSRLPVREGETLTLDSVQRVRETVVEFDPQLRVTFHAPLKALRAQNAPSDRQVSLQIAPIKPAQTAEPAWDPAGSTLRLRVVGNAQESKTFLKVQPLYPVEAKQAHIEGVVSLAVAIDKQGTVQNITVIRGEPALVPAALEAVSQWVYQPTFLNGAPVDVLTQVDVNFTLAR